MKKLFVDIDNTLSSKSDSASYQDAKPNYPMIEKLNSLRGSAGIEVILYTARNMKTFNGDVSKINLNTIPVIVEWCARHGLEIDGIIVGKPYGGEGYFFIDDRAVRPDEFLDHSIDELLEIMEYQAFK